MTECLEKYNCPRTRLEGLLYSVCSDFTDDASALDPGEIEQSLSIPHDRDVFSITKGEKWNGKNVFCIKVQQEIDPKKNLHAQLLDGFNTLNDVKDTLSKPVASIFVSPIHQNLRFFVWDFREHEDFLGELGEFAESTGGCKLEAHDYAAVEYLEKLCPKEERIT